MRKSFPLAIVAAMLCALLAGCGKEENLKRHIVLYPNSKNFKEEWTIKLLPNGDTVMQGVNKEYFWNGSTKKSVIWKDGKRDGSAQAWYDNGQVKWQKSYEMGKKVNTWRLFFNDGHPWIVVAYVNGAIDGKVQAWDRNDLDKSITAEYKNGSCVSGDCSLLEPKPVKEDAPPPEKAEAARVAEILQDFSE